MRRYVAQPNHCVALGIRQDRLVAEVSVRQARLRLCSGFIQRSGETTRLEWRHLGTRPVAQPVVACGTRMAMPMAVRMRGGMSPAGRSRAGSSR
jgi:hypothetical protein